MPASLVPFFSIVIPVLNEEKTLPKFLKDLEQQSFTQFEVIVVDGNSEDKTQAIVKKFQKKKTLKLKLVIAKKRNVGHQRNLGASLSKGEFVFFFDADSRIPSHYLEGIHYQALKQGFDACSTWCEPDTQDSKDKLFLMTLNVIFEQASKMGMHFAFGAAICCRRAVFKKIGGFDETITYMEDTELVKRVAKDGYSFVILRDPMFTYSLRRMRKEGTLQYFRKVTPTSLIPLLTNKMPTKPVEAYPMLGGSYFETFDEKKLREKPSLHRLTNVWAAVTRLALAPQIKLKHMLEDLLKEF